MSITIKEIANLAGTSRGTVDRALNNRGRVKYELKEKILEIARKHNYTTNPFAKALSQSKKEFKIGIIINSLDNNFFDKVIDGLYSGIKEISQYDVKLELIQIKGYDINEQMKAVDTLMEKKVLAIGITPINCIAIKEKLENLSVPVLAINNDIEMSQNKIAFVGCNYKESGLICGDMISLILREEGNILIVAGTMKLLGHNQRVKGIEKVLKVTKINIVNVIENHDDDKISYNLVKDNLAGNNDIDLVCFVAAGIKGGLKAIDESGENVSIIAVDETVEVVNALRSGRIKCSITQQPYKQGRSAIRIICQLIINEIKPTKDVYHTINKVLLKHLLLK